MDFTYRFPDVASTMRTVESLTKLFIWKYFSRHVDASASIVVLDYLKRPIDPSELTLIPLLQCPHGAPANGTVESRMHFYFYISVNYVSSTVRTHRYTRPGRPRRSACRSATFGILPELEWADATTGPMLLLSSRLPVRRNGPGSGDARKGFKVQDGGRRSPI